MRDASENPNLIDHKSVSRPMGEHETLLHTIHNFGSLIVIQVLHLNARISAENLQKALAKIQQIHPITRAQVKFKGLRLSKSAPYIVPQYAFDTANTLQIPIHEEHGDWQQAVEAELGKPIKGKNLPRFRTRLVHEVDKSHLILTADHAAVDAQSCNMIARDLLNLLGGNSVEKVEVVTPNFPDALEASFTQKSQSGDVTYVPAKRIPISKDKGAGRGTKVFNRRLDAASTSDLKNAAQSNRTSVHGTVTAAFLFALHDKYQLDDLTCISTADLRRMANPPIPNDVAGSFIDILRTQHDLRISFWDLAKDVSMKLVMTLARNHKAASILRWFDGEVYRNEFIGMAKHEGRLDPVTVTTASESGLNGNFGDLYLEGVTMAVSLALFGPSMMAILCERDGGMDISICYAAVALSNADAQDITDRALEILAQETAAS